MRIFVMLQSVLPAKDTSRLRRNSTTAAVLGLKFSTRMGKRQLHTATALWMNRSRQTCGRRTIGSNPKLGKKLLRLVSAWADGHRFSQTKCFLSPAPSLFTAGESLKHCSRKQKICMDRSLCCGEGLI